MRVKLWVDGGCRGNPGPSSIGFVIKDAEGNDLRRHGAHIGVCTNNLAEYSSLIAGLYNCACIGATHVTVYTDSKLVEGQMTGAWRVQSNALKPYVEEAQIQVDRFESVEFNWIPRRENKEADQLTRDILDGEKNG